MHKPLLISFSALVGLAGVEPPVLAAPNACATQGPTSPTDYMRPLSRFTWKTISVSSYVDPSSRRDAYAIRASQRDEVDDVALIELVKFRLEYDCNRYFVENSWSGEISTQDFEKLLDLTAPVLAKSSFANTREGNTQDRSLLDGPVTDLTYRSRLWSVRRDLLFGAQEGFDIMAAFQQLAETVVPLNEHEALPWIGTPS